MLTTSQKSGVIVYNLFLWGSVLWCPTEVIVAFSREVEWVLKLSWLCWKVHQTRLLVWSACLEIKQSDCH